MKALEEFTAYEYFFLTKIAFAGVCLVSIPAEDAAKRFCEECGSSGVWEPVTQSSHLPMFDATTGDRFQYDALICARKKFSWKAWRTRFKTPCRLFLVFRRSALKRSR